MMPTVQPRVLAFYLPQFHPIPENDRWWGSGFTEWTNVKRARALFDGHPQPNEPGELGYYDLRSPDVRRAQADLARAHGISGFCYYHYWFNGQRLLGHVVDQVLSSGEPDFPFCLCWANESWTRTWDGLDRDVLMRQTYGAEDDRAHIRWLTRLFEDPRYIRVDGRPLLLVYRAQHLPSALRTATIWREEAQRLGVGDLYLCNVESLPSDRVDPTRIGFDAAVEFQPDWQQLGTPTTTLPSGTRVFDYAAIAERMLAKPPAPYVRHPGITPAWDNSPRRRDGIVLADSSPELYGRWLEALIARTPAPTADEALVFINAWNEWGEGAHLEPSARWGRAYLEQTRDVVARIAMPVQVRAPHAAPTRQARVTVALPTCNGATHVGAAIESVLSQTFHDFELIVVDDASDDGTMDVVSRFPDERLRVERNQVRLGPVRNWNRCLEAARGAYVVVFSQDAVMAPDNLARKAAMLDQHPDVAFVYSDVTFIAAGRPAMADVAGTAPDDAGVREGRAFLERLFWDGSGVHAASVVMRRDALSRHGVFDTQLPFTADCEMWMRLCLSHDVAHLPDALVSLHGSSGDGTDSARNADRLEWGFMARHRLLVKAGSLVPGAEWRARLVEHYEHEAVRLARAAVTHGDRSGARSLLLLASNLRAYVPDTDHGDVDKAIDLLVRLCDGWEERDEQKALREHSRMLERTTQALSRDKHDLESDVRVLTERLREAEAQVRGLKASGSWRLTAPLRLVLRVLTGRSA